MSNIEPMEVWRPDVVFVKQKSRESNFTNEEEKADSAVFQETSLVTSAENSESLERPIEDLDELIEPLEPLELISSQQSQEPTLDIEAVKQKAYQEGEAKGRIEGQRLAQERALELQQQFEIEARDEISSFMSSVRASLIHHNALAEPLKRLALSLAELIARAELQLSAQSIDNLIGRIISELEPSELEDVVIAVSPGWYRQITSEQFKGIFESCEIQVSEQLSDGSVRLSLKDKAIEDLLEDRISEIASQVFNVKFPISTASTQEHHSASETIDANLSDSAKNKVTDESVQEIDVDETLIDSKETIENSETENVVESDLNESEIDNETSFVLDPPAPDELDFEEPPAEEDG